MNYSNTTHNCFGLICGYREDAVYGITMLWVLTNTKKRYTVLESAGSRWEVLATWKESSLLRAGYNQANLLRLEYNNLSREYTLYINGYVETVFKDESEPFHTTGKEGYAVLISPLDDFPAIPVEVQFEERGQI